MRPVLQGDVAVHELSLVSSQILLAPTEAQSSPAGQSRDAVHWSWQSENTQTSGEAQSVLSEQPWARVAGDLLLLQPEAAVDAIASVTGRPKTKPMVVPRRFMGRPPTTQTEAARRSPPSLL
jgi:hypothetical protein